jgi:AcrR family transcriptional regulator
MRSNYQDARPNPETPVQEGPSFIEAARRAQIVQCAAATIAELGYQRASLSEIAKRARISKSVISYYFASKDDLIMQVVIDVYTAGTLFMMPRLQALTSARDLLRTYIESNVAFMAVNRPLVRAVVEIVFNFRDESGVSKLDPHGADQAVTDLEMILRQGQESGEFRDFPPTPMAFAIRSALDMLPPRLAIYPDLDLEAYAAELAELFDRATVRDPDQEGAPS